MLGVDEKRAGWPACGEIDIMDSPKGTLRFGISRKKRHSVKTECRPNKQNRAGTRIFRCKSSLCRGQLNSSLFEIQPYKLKLSKTADLPPKPGSFLDPHENPSRMDLTNG
jgi:hypothetical protein